MKNTLYYFSGTGNSLQVARDIAVLLGDTDVIPLATASGNVPQEAESIGIVFPVYMWGLPLAVARFLQNMGGLNGKYIFAVATFGGSPGATLRQASTILQGKGIELSAGFVVKMPGNYVPMYDALSLQKQQKMFDGEKKKVDLIARAVRETKTGAIETSNFLVNRFLSGYFYRFCAPRIPAMDKRFWVNDRCDGCGICAAVCAVRNIALENGKPVWRHRCEQCMACLQWCPREALQCGKNTPGRKRYHHPGTVVRDFTVRG
jgi:ferredoxin